MKIVIEDYFGNDLCSFFAEIRPFDDEYLDDGFKKFNNCDIADRDIDEDGDEYIRIQLTNPFIADKV